MFSDERVELAAIRCRGEIFTGNSHAEAYCCLLAKFPDVSDNELPPDECNGFITNRRPYVNRTEALRIATAARQISTGHTPNDGKLRSQHLTHKEPAS